MATKSKTVNVDLNSVFEGAASQFRGRNTNEHGQWPLLPTALTFVAEVREHGALDHEHDDAEPQQQRVNL